MKRKLCSSLSRKRIFGFASIRSVFHSALQPAAQSIDDAGGPVARDGKAAMISSQYKVIYLHAPKTGGNSIQSVLLPFSDDSMVLKGHQDGVERFEIEGVYTPRKHAVLADYATHLGERLSEYRVAISVRHPFRRAVSYYFSPHRWMEMDPQTRAWRKRPPFWGIAAFAACLSEIIPMTDFVAVRGGLRAPDFVIRYETLVADFRSFVDGAGLPPACAELPHRSRSAAPDSVREALGDGTARGLVAERYAADFGAFGYEPGATQGHGG